LEIIRYRGNWTDENNRPILCEFEDGVVGTANLAILVKKKSPFFEVINDVVGHIVEGGLFAHIKKPVIQELKLEHVLNFSTSDDTYYAISVRHLQTSFYLLMLGYVLSVLCFVTEIMWHCYWSKGRGQTRAFHVMS